MHGDEEQWKWEHRGAWFFISRKASEACWATVMGVDTRSQDTEGTRRTSDVGTGWVCDKRRETAGKTPVFLTSDEVTHQEGKPQGQGVVWAECGAGNRKLV